MPQFHYPTHPREPRAILHGACHKIEGTGTVNPAASHWGAHYAYSMSPLDADRVQRIDMRLFCAKNT